MTHYNLLANCGNMVWFIRWVCLHVMLVYLHQTSKWIALLSGMRVTTDDSYFVLTRGPDPSAERETLSDSESLRP